MAKQITLLFIFPRMAVKALRGPLSVILVFTSIAIIDLRRSILLLLMFAVTIVVGGAICFVYLPAINILLPASYAYTANRIYDKVFAPYMTDDEAIPAIESQVKNSK